MSEPNAHGSVSGTPIPGPDPGACPDCGGWRRAGMVHVCDGLSYVERGTDEARDGEGFLETPLPYDEACKVEELFERLERAETTLRAVHENATNHHSGEDGKARALYVIGNWTAEVLHGRIHRDAALVGRSDS